MNIDRRLFLLTISAPLYPATPLAFFSPGESNVVEALCAQIIPADDVPGAKEAGVLYYIDRQLAGPLQRFGPIYRAGIPALSAACREKTGRNFESLTFQEQTAFLLDIETGRFPALRDFLEVVVDHTMQGFYGSPSHGGNRDEASWKMLDIVDVMEGHKH